MLDLPQLAQYLSERHTHDLIRIETLDTYLSASDGDEFDRFRRGDPEPDRASKAGWLNKLREDTARGREWRRVRVIQPPPTEYVRYECEWGYTDNSAAGEDVRVLDLSNAPDGADLLTRVGDFYLVDGIYAAAMDYDERGAYRTAIPIEGPLADAYRYIAAAAWNMSEPFTSWWAAHPQYHRHGIRERATQG